MCTKTSDAQDVTPTNVTVHRGGQVTLNCSGTRVTWFRTRGSFTDKLFTSPDTWYAQDGNKYDIIGNYYLVIKDAEPSTDGGTYHCDTNENRHQLFNAGVVVLGNISVKFVCRPRHCLLYTSPSPRD